MDRLISLEPSNVVVIRVEQGQKCYGKLNLRNVMYTMPVAFLLQPENKARYTVRPQSGIISPLTDVTVEIVYDFPPNSSLPESYNDTFLLHSVVVPGAAVKNSYVNDSISVSVSVPSDWFTTRKKQVFVDSGIKVVFVGLMILTKVVMSGSLEEIRDVLEKSDPAWKAVDSVDSEGQTLLHLAIARGRADLVQVLLEFEPDIEARSRLGSTMSTPLEAATALGESLIVELLLAREASTERLEPSEWGPIHLAAGRGHVDILKLLLLKGVDVDALTKDGNTALHIAVEEQRRDCVRLLLARGAQPDICNSGGGDTPLHIAAAFGDENMVRLLIQKGANKNIQNRSRKTAYAVAVEHGHTHLYNALRLDDSLCIAASKGNIRTINRLLEGGVAVNTRDQNGWTVLHRASFKGRADVVRVLIKNGVDIDARDQDGYTALHCAVESGQVDVLELLLKKGANVEARTNKGATAMQIALSLNYTGITRVLTRGTANNDEPAYGSKTGSPYSNGTSSMKKRTTRARAIRGSFDQSATPLTVI